MSRADDQRHAVRILAVVGILLAAMLAIPAAYRASGSTSRELAARRDTLDQQYRCIMARGRNLRGAGPAACRAFNAYMGWTSGR